jgi:hypothetical protein
MLSLIALATILPGLQARPANAIVLFDGADTSGWVHRRSGEACKWEVKDGELIVKAGLPDLMTKREFGDYRLHLEFWLPLEADKTDQARANSGVYNQGRYEIQILDNWNNKTYPMGGCGALYGQKDPDKDAIRPPQYWNTYDFLFTAARFDPAGKLAAKPRISVWHNGLRIHHEVEIEKPQTVAGVEGAWIKKGPILLQNHGSPIRFRNIWIVEM